jgi:hypothetical protein
LYQHLKSGVERIYIDSFSRKWNYKPDSSSLKITHSILGKGQVAQPTLLIMQYK